MVESGEDSSSETSPAVASSWRPVNSLSTTLIHWLVAQRGCAQWRSGSGRLLLDGKGDLDSVVGTGSIGWNAEIRTGFLVESQVGCSGSAGPVETLNTVEKLDLCGGLAGGRAGYGVSASSAGLAAAPISQSPA
jgi:hypothetical protein